MVIILGLTLTLIKDLFDLYDKTSPESKTKSLTLPGRIATTLGIIIAIIGIALAYSNNKSAELEVQAKNNLIQLDSSRHREILVRDSIIIENGKSEIILNERLLQLSDSINELLVDKISNQERQIANLQNDLRESLLPIRDDFECDLVFVLSNDELSKVIKEYAPSDFNMMGYIPINIGSTQMGYKNEKLIAEKAREYFSEILLSITISLNPKYKTRDDLILRGAMYPERDHMQVDFQTVTQFSEFTTFSLSYEIKENLFRIQINNMPLNIYRRTDSHSTIKDIKDSYLSLGILTPRFDPQSYTIKGPGDSGYYDYTDIEQRFWNLEKLEISSGPVEIGIYSYFKEKDGALRPTHILLW